MLFTLKMFGFQCPDSVGLTVQFGSEFAIFSWTFLNAGKGMFSLRSIGCHPMTAEAEFLV
jgi:hypothetical protein